MSRFFYTILLATGAATELDLAWTHDGWRLAGVSLCLALLWLVRGDLTRSET